MGDRAGGRHLERAAADGRAAGIGAGRGEGEGAVAEFFERAPGTGEPRRKIDVLATGVDADRLPAGRADPGGIVNLIGSVVLERAPSEGDRSAASDRVEAAEGEHAAVEIRAAGVAVASREDERPCPLLRERAGAGDRSGKGRGVGAVENEGGIVHDVAGDRTGCVATAKAQGTRRDRRVSVVAIVGREGERAAAELRQGVPGTLEGRGERHVRAVGVDVEGLPVGGADAGRDVDCVGGRELERAAEELDRPGGRVGGADGAGVSEPERPTLK